MPTSRAELREKFLCPPDDGIQRCENIIKAKGGTISEKYFVTLPLDEFEDDEFWDALEYLITEWDYGIA